jgi:SWI/SNF-related matrix-associated actin-dependent regulator 1 of chromatin subfamily A
MNLGKSLIKYPQLPANFKYKADDNFKDWLNQQLRRYNYKLKKHQVDAVQFIMDKDNCIIADEMGLGKTFSAIASVIAGEYKKAVFVVPASLVDTWIKELDKFGVHANDIFPTKSTKAGKEYLEYSKPEMTKEEKIKELIKILKTMPIEEVMKELSSLLENKILTYEEIDRIEDELDTYYETLSPEEKAKINLSGEKDFILKGYTALKGYLNGDIEQRKFCIMSYNLFSRLQEDIIFYNPDFVCFDEAHFLKNAKSKRTKNAHQLRDALNNTKFVLMTGTPITGRYKDLVSLFYLVDAPEEEIETVRILAKELDKAKRKAKKGQDLTNIEETFNELADIMTKYIIRRKKDAVLNLPPKFLRIVWLSLTTEERKEYTKALETYEMLTGKDYSMSKARMMVEMLKWRQFASHIKVNKIIPFLQLLLDKGLKMVLFCSFKETVEKLKEAFGELAVVIDGKTSKIQRKRNQELFQKFDKRVLIANVKTASTGFTWHAGSEAIFIDLDWTPTTHMQAMDRLHRIGQDKSVYVYYFLLADTIEEYVYRKNWEKSEVIQAYLGEKNQMRSIKEVDLKQLTTETEKRKESAIKYKSYDDLFDEFIRICQKYIEKDEQELEEFKKGIEEYERKTGRKAVRKRKQAEKWEWNIDSLFYDKDINLARLYISTDSKDKVIRPANRPFITFQEDKASNEWKTGERIETKYKNFYIYYLEEDHLKVCKGAVDELIDLSGGVIEGMLSGFKPLLEGNKDISERIKNKWVALRIGNINPAYISSLAFDIGYLMYTYSDVEKVIEIIEDMGYDPVLPENWREQVRKSVKDKASPELFMKKGYVYASVNYIESVDDLLYLLEGAESEWNNGFREEGLQDRIYIAIEDFDVFDVNKDAGEIVKSNVDWIDITEFMQSTFNI